MRGLRPVVVVGDRLSYASTFAWSLLQFLMFISMATTNPQATTTSTSSARTTLAAFARPHTTGNQSCSHINYRPWASAFHLSSSTKATVTTTTNGEGPHLTTQDVLSLESIRASLIRQEETIIFALIERAQYRRNTLVYEKGALLGPHTTPPPASTYSSDEPLSFLEYMLLGTEALHAQVRRFTSPEEHAFFPQSLPPIKLEELQYPQDLLSSVGGASDLNFNPILLQKYIQVIVPAIAKKEGDDEQYGSTVLADVAVLQALSRRIHYGKFVAESKYLADPQAYQELVDAGNAAGAMELLTNAAVEAKVLRRARLKAATYGTEPLLADLPPLSATAEETSIVAAAAASAVVAAIEAMGRNKDKNSNKVCPATVESVYRDIIIPMTKDIEVAYLFRRCGREPPPAYAPDRMSIDVTELSTTITSSISPPSPL